MFLICVLPIYYNICSILYVKYVIIIFLIKIKNAIFQKKKKSEVKNYNLK